MKFDWLEPFKGLRRSDIAVGLLVAVPLYVLLQTCGLGFFGGFLTGLVFMMVAVGRKRAMRTLEARIEAPHEAARWRVEVNGIHVGNLSDAEYAAIRLSALERRDLYLRQAQNLIGILVNVFNQWIQALPALAACVVLSVAVLSPEIFGEWLTAARSVTPQQIVASVPAALGMFTTVTIVMLFFTSLLTGAQFGFVNRFSEAIGYQVRRRLGVAALGEIVLELEAPADPLHDVSGAAQ